MTFFAFNSIFFKNAFSLLDNPLSSVKADNDTDNLNSGVKSMWDRSKKPIKNILDSFILNKVIAKKSFKDGNHELTNELFSDDVNTLSLRVGGSWKNGAPNPYFNMSTKDCKFGLKYKATDTMLADVGFKQTDKVKSLFVAGKFNHSYSLVSADLEGLFFPFKDPTKMNFSAKFGHQLDKVGLLAGFELTKPDIGTFRLSDIEKTASFGAFVSNGMFCFDIKSNNVLNMTCAWKINEVLEVAARVRNSWNLTSWTNKQNELGILYRHSESQSVGVKADLDGKLTLGAWWKQEAMKLALSIQTNTINNTSEPLRYGVSFEF